MLKNTIDKQIYARTREPLGLVQQQASNNILYGASDVSWKSKDIEWNIVWYNHKRFSEYKSRGFNFESFLTFYGDTHESIGVVSTAPVNGSLASYDNCVFYFKIKAEQFTQYKIAVQSTAVLDGGIFCYSGLYYNGVWYKKDEFTSEEIGSLPANTDIIFAIGMYCDSKSSIPYTIKVLFDNLNFSTDSKVPLEIPDWTTLTLEKNEKTKNLAIKCTWSQPKNRLMWTGVNIWRRKFLYATETLYKVPGVNVVNGFSFDTGNLANNYITGKPLYRGSNQYTTDLSYDLTGNLLSDNSEFDTISNWTFSHTAASSKRSSAYSTKKRPFNGDRCLVFEMYATAAVTKTSWMTHNRVTCYEDNYTLLYSIRTDVDTSFNPYWKFRFFQDGAGTVKSATASAIAYCGVSSSWSQQSISLGHNPGVTKDIYIPSDAQTTRIDFYACYGQKTAYNIYLDCVGFYPTANALAHNASSQPLTVINISDNISAPLNNSTVDLWALTSTVKGVNGKTLTRNVAADVLFRGPKFTSGYFGGGHETRDVSINYIRAGDFTNRNRFHLSTSVSFVTDTSISLYNSPMCYFSYASGIAYVSTARTLTSTTLGGATSWCVSIWAKSINGNPNIAIKIGDNTNTKSYLCSLTDTWRRYVAYHTLPRTSSKTLYTAITNASSYMGSFYLQGFQCEPNKITNFITKTTAAGQANTQMFQTAVATMNTILAASCGSISAFFTPMINSNQKSANYEGIFGVSSSIASGQMRFLYDWTNKRVRFDHNTTVYHTLSFVELEPIFIGVRWDKNNYYTFVNGTKRQLPKIKNPTVVAAGTYAFFRFGHVTGAAAGNWIVSNVRVDTAALDDTTFFQEAKAEVYSPSLSTGSFYTNDYTPIFINKAHQAGDMVYVDETNIEPNTIYGYRLQNVDGRNVSELSSEQFINTKQNYPNPVISTSSKVGANWIEYYWKASSVGIKPDKFAIYSNTDKNIGGTYGPFWVNYATSATVYEYDMYGIVDTTPRKIWVLPVDAWGGYDTANARLIVGHAGEEYFYRNLLVNNSFEDINIRRTPSFAVGWSSSLQTSTTSGKVTHKYFYNWGQGGAAAVLSSGYSLKVGRDSLGHMGGAYQTIDFPNLVTKPGKFTYSHWTHSGSSNKVAKYAYIYFNDAYGNTNGGCVGVMSKVDEAVGSDGNRWYRYATTFNSTADYDSAYQTPSKVLVYCYMNATDTGHEAYIDSCQLEFSSVLSTYSQPDRGRLNVALGYQNLTAGSLNIENFPDNTLVIATHTGTDGRIVVGREEYGNTFIEMTPTRFRYHPSNVSTAGGYYYPKHIECGSKKFGQNVIFSGKFLKWDGSYVAPNILISPSNIITYSTNASLAGSGREQKLTMYVSTATSGGFIARAALYTGGKFFEQSINQVATPTYTTEFKSYNYPVRACTVLPFKSKTSIGTFKVLARGAFEVPRGQWPLSGDPYVTFKIYCTSKSVRTWGATSNWRLLSSSIMYIPSIQTQNSFNINSPYFAVASSVAYYMSSCSGVSAKIAAYVDPFSIYYSSAATITNIYTDSAVGSFNYIAMDGGSV